MTTTAQEDDQLVTRLAEVNEQAMAISRRGLTATRDNAHYADLHANLDFLLTVWEAQQ